MHVSSISWVLVLSLLQFGVGFPAEVFAPPQTQSGGGVTVKVTYLTQSHHESRFSIVLDAHSVDLDAYDVKALSILRDSTGMALTPTAAENKGSGHHREIILTFPGRLMIGNGWSL